MTARGFNDCIQRVKLPSGAVRFRLRVWTGKKLRKATFPSKEAAQAARDFLLARRRAESLGIPPPAWPQPAATVGSVFAAFEKRLVNLGRSEAYVKQVRGIRKLWAAFRGETGLASFTRRDLEEFVGWARQPGRTKSHGRQIKTAIAILRMVLRDAELPVPRAPIVEVPKRAPKTITKEQLEKYQAALGWGTVERAFAELDLRTGIRESEARALTVADIDLEGGVLRVRHGKGRPGERGSEELHPIPPGAALALRAYVDRFSRGIAREAPFLTIQSRRPRKGGRLQRRSLTKDSLRKRLQVACKAAGIPARGGLGWLRHQAVTLARTSGAGILAPSLALGHSDERMVGATYDESARATEERWRARAELGARIDALVPVVAPGFAESRQPREMARSAGAEASDDPVDRP